jgi:hypothetical protein
MKTVNPSPAVSILLPEDVLENYNDRVSSYWRKGDTCLLQMGRFLSESGSQVRATQLLSERTVIHGTWKSLDLFRKPEGLEAAGAIMVDEQGVCWVQLYLVWQRLAVHVTVSRQGPLEACPWVWNSLASIRAVDSNASFFRGL